MANALQLRRGTTAQHGSFTGLAGEVTVDTDKDTVVVHDGSTAGGIPLAKEAALSGYATTASLSGYVTTASLSGYATTASLANVATSGAYSDLSGTPSASDLLTSIKTVDGPASGLDADTLDGKQLATLEAEYQSYADTAVSNLVAAAPATLDTLNELAAALGDDPNFATTVTNSIAAKLPLAGGTMTGAITFAAGQTFDGRDVSSDGAKLDGIEAGADVTDTANVTAAGALMDSEVTNLAAVKSFDPTDYATAAQGSLADSSVQPNDSPTFVNGTFTGELIANSYNETYSALSGTTPSVNCEAGNAFSLTLSGNTTFTFSNPPASGTAYSFSLEVIQDASASGYTITWPASVDWPAATAPTLTATASAVDVFVFYTRDGGTTWHGFVAGQAQG